MIHHDAHYELHPRLLIQILLLVYRLNQLIVRISFLLNLPFDLEKLN